MSAKDTMLANSLRNMKSDLQILMMHDRKSERAKTAKLKPKQRPCKIMGLLLHSAVALVTTYCLGGVSAVWAYMTTPETRFSTNYSRSDGDGKHFNAYSKTANVSCGRTS